MLDSITSVVKKLAEILTFDGRHTVYRTRTKALFVQSAFWQRCSAYRRLANVEKGSPIHRAPKIGLTLYKIGPPFFRLDIQYSRLGIEEVLVEKNHSWKKTIGRWNRPTIFRFCSASMPLIISAANKGPFLLIIIIKKRTFILAVAIFFCRMSCSLILNDSLCSNFVAFLMFSICFKCLFFM